MAASWAVIWDSVCDFLHGKSQALSEGSAVKPAIRGSPTYSQSFTARLKSCPDTKQSFSAACKGRTLQKDEFSAACEACTENPAEFVWPLYAEGSFWNEMY